MSQTIRAQLLEQLFKVHTKQEAAKPKKTRGKHQVANALEPYIQHLDRFTLPGLRKFSEQIRNTHPDRHTDKLYYDLLTCDDLVEGQKAVTNVYLYCANAHKGG